MNTDWYTEESRFQLIGLRLGAPFKEEFEPDKPKLDSLNLNPIVYSKIRPPIWLSGHGIIEMIDRTMNRLGNTLRGLNSSNYDPHKVLHAFVFDTFETVKELAIEGDKEYDLAIKPIDDIYHEALSAELLAYTDMEVITDDPFDEYSHSWNMKTHIRREVDFELFRPVRAGLFKPFKFVLVMGTTFPSTFDIGYKEL